MKTKKYYQHRLSEKYLKIWVEVWNSNITANGSFTF